MSDFGKGFFDTDPKSKEEYRAEIERLKAELEEGGVMAKYEYVVIEEQRAEIERLTAELAKAREREEIMCLALTNQIEFEWSDDYVVGPGYGRMVVEYPYGTEVRTFEGRWDDCLDDAAREEE